MYYKWVWTDNEIYRLLPGRNYASEATLRQRLLSTGTLLGSGFRRQMFISSGLISPWVDEHLTSTSYINCWLHQALPTVAASQAEITYTSVKYSKFLVVFAGTVALGIGSRGKE
jgi:hypothetical protein